MLDFPAHSGWHFSCCLRFHFTLYVFFDSPLLPIEVHMPDPLAETFRRFPATCAEMNRRVRALLEQVDTLMGNDTIPPSLLQDDLASIRANLCSLASQQEQVRTSMRAAWAAHAGELSAPAFIALRDRSFTGEPGALVGLVRRADIVGIRRTLNGDSKVVLRGGGVIEVQADMEDILRQISPTPTAGGAP